MRVSIERLRVWLLVGAGLLVAVIAAFLGYAHLRARSFLRELPGRLGADITRESNAYTYSQSSKGRTVYTIHAAKLVQRKDGKTTLHDVGIVLYGEKQDRADRIYGSEFEYDQKAGVVRAVGEVHLDLQAPAPTDARGRAAYAAGHEVLPDAHSGAHGDGDDRLVHVKTSGLVFEQKLGVASTDQEIEFQYHGLNGRAKGADYNSATGMTVLQSEVRVSGLRDGHPVLLTANHAEMDRAKQQLVLAHARYVSVGERSTGRDEGRTLTAEEAVAHLRSDGSVERVLADGGVALAQGGGTLRGQRADVSLSAESRPVVAHLSGGLTYGEDTALRQVQGKAGQGTAHFSGTGRIESAEMTEAATVHVQERAANTAAWNERTVSGDRVDVRFATAAGNRVWMQGGTAAGAARMVMVDRRGKGSGMEERRSEVRGDSLVAQMVWDGRAARLSHVTGVGHTSLRRSDAGGGEDTSEGDALEVSFGPGGVADGRAGSAVVQGAVQRGGVHLTHVPGVKTGGAMARDATHAEAEQASFEGDGQSLTLSGKVQVVQGTSLVRADTVTMRNGTGDGTAQGSVQASYRQDGSAEAVHVVAARAVFTHDGGNAVFYGAAAGGAAGGGATAARLWQGGSQVEAPVLEFSQADKTLVASTGTASGQVVRTVLASERTGGEARSGGRSRPEVMRVVSRGLRYSDADRKAVFTGGVVLDNADGTVRGQEVDALLKARAGAAGGSASGKAGPGLMGGGVERVTAEGGVEVSEPGRHAFGDRLLYTASDGQFVLTGTAGTPPRVVDEAQGTITGAALQFHAGDNSVMVLANAKGGEGRRVHTETQVRQPR